MLQEGDVLRLVAGSVTLRKPPRTGAEQYMADRLEDPEFQEFYRQARERHSLAVNLRRIVYGTPRIVGVLTINGEGVARTRDSHYHRPPDYICIEPQDTKYRTENLQQTNVAGYKWQSTSATEIAEAQLLVDRHAGRAAEPHSPIAQALAAKLMSRFNYRLDTNFAKIDRINHPEIEKFKSEILAKTFRSRKLIDWASLLKALNRPKSEEDYARAEAVIRAIYNESL